MVWLFGAIGVAAITGVISIVDSHLISRRMPGFQAFLLPVGVLHLSFAAIGLGLFPLPQGLTATALLAAFGSSAARVIGALLMLRTMRTEEVSRVMPVTNTFPIFVALLAVPLLGEELGWVEWLAIFITVTGAVLISTQRAVAGQSGFRLRRSFLTLMGSSFLFGLGNVGSKYALGFISPWNMYAVTALVLGIVFLLCSARPSVVRQIRHMTGRNRALALITGNEVLSLVGFTLVFWAISQGPVSIVSTILGTRPVFVFIFALVVSRFSPALPLERFTRATTALKVVSIALVVGGVTLLTLNGA